MNYLKFAEWLKKYCCTIDAKTNEILIAVNENSRPLERVENTTAKWEKATQVYADYLIRQEER